MPWYAWLILVGVAILAVLGFETFPFTAFLSWVGAALCGALATLALARAVLIPPETPEGLRDLFRFDADDATAATSWVRWALVVLAIAVMVIPRLWGRAIWPDVAVALVLTLGIYAIVKQHERAKTPKNESPPATLTFLFKASAVTTLGDVPEEKDAYLFVVRPKTVTDSTVVAYESKRYEAKRVACADANNICVAVERGNKDANIASLTAVAEAPTRIYLSPRE